MSEEEKKAIEILQHYLEMEEFDSAGDFLISIDKLLNLTKKQQKEIEHELNQRKYWRDNFYEQQKEIEEKTTIIMAGAEKVKQLEKEIQRLEKDNDTLSELVIVNEDKVINELDLISKDKIREKIKELEKEKTEVIHELDFKGFYTLSQLKDIEISVLKELLEEK